MTKALAMVSGGLDSILAAKLIMEQGIEVIGICYKSYFFGADNAIKMANEIGMELKIIDFSPKHMELVKKPKHGWGKNLNPCIDCHTMMLNYTGSLLKELNADFIITGEVLNQRPMSQNKVSLELVRKGSGYEDKILRPLSALNLSPTIMEEEGLVDRSKLLGLIGRERKEQMAMAEKWGIVDYPSPAGGCKLTEPNYCRRLKDLLKYIPDPTEVDLKLLDFGRHFRVSHSTKIISTRTAGESESIKKLLDESFTIFLASDYNGSLVIISGDINEESIKIAGRICARYSKGKDQGEISIKYGQFKHPLENIVIANSIEEEELQKYII